MSDKGSTADCDHCAPHEWDHEIAVAKRALGQGDARHAAFHAAFALALRPDDAATLALDDPAAAEDARPWCWWLSKQAPSRGHCSWAATMEHLSKVLPGMPPDLLDPLKGWLAGDSQQDEKAS